MVLRGSYEYAWIPNVLYMYFDPANHKKSEVWRKPFNLGPGAGQAGPKTRQNGGFGLAQKGPHKGAKMGPKMKPKSPSPGSPGHAKLNVQWWSCRKADDCQAFFSDLVSGSVLWSFRPPFLSHLGLILVTCSVENGAKTVPGQKNTIFVSYKRVIYCVIACVIKVCHDKY